MKKHRKLITALLTLSLCASCFTMTAHAEPENPADALSAVEEAQPPAVESSAIDAPADESSILQDPDPEPAPAPDNEPSAVSSEAQQNNNYNNYNYYNDYDNNYDSESSYAQDYDYNDYDSSSYYNQNFYVENQGDNSSNLGGQNSYVPQQNVAPTAELYETDDRKFDGQELSDKDWKEIQAVLGNAKNSGTDSDDFSFIKNNVSKNDNGDWMLIVGVAVILISLAGITYFIISTVNQRKKTAAGATPGGSYSSAEAQRRSISDSYNDGYRSASPKKSKKAQNRSKFDTADIPQTRSQNNGRRYR